jgi:energy-coupling factor transporter transmembrane protein EcfT
MKQIDFYKEGTTLLYVKRDNEENSIYLILMLGIIGVFSMIIIESLKISWLVNILKFIVIGFIILIYVIKIFTEKNRPQNSKYFLYIINEELFYERITPEKEGFNNDNELTNFDIVKFIDEKGSVIKIISNKELPWEKRKIQIAKEYLPFKHQIIKYLNKNYTMSKIESEMSILLKKHLT